jgi:hypothetical protein
MENQIEQQPMIDRGVRAEELLKNETFGLAVKDVVDNCIGAFLNSGNGDEKLREVAYYQAQAINQVIGVLQQWVAIKETILAEEANEEV